MRIWKCHVNCLTSMKPFYPIALEHLTRRRMYHDISSSIHEKL